MRHDLSHIRRAGFVIAALLFLVLALAARAEDAPEAPPPDQEPRLPWEKKPTTQPAWPESWYGNFRINGLVVFAPGRGYIVAPEISWNPTFALAKEFLILANFGITALKNQNAIQRNFVVTDYELLAAYFIDGGYLELGGGAQSWPDNGGMRPVASGNVNWALNPSFFVFQRLFLGYSAYFSTLGVEHEIKAGIGVSF